MYKTRQSTLIYPLIRHPKWKGSRFTPWRPKHTRPFMKWPPPPPLKSRGCKSLMMHQTIPASFLHGSCQVEVVWLSIHCREFLRGPPKWLWGRVRKSTSSMFVYWIVKAVSGSINCSLRTCVMNRLTVWAVPDFWTLKWVPPWAILPLPQKVICLFFEVILGVF